MLAWLWKFNCALVRDILTHYRFGPHYVSRSRDFGKRGFRILETDETLIVIRQVEVEINL
jgi:hypothetical protein